MTTALWTHGIRVLQTELKNFLKHYHCCCIGDVVYEAGSYGGHPEDEKNGYRQLLFPVVFQSPNPISDLGVDPINQLQFCQGLQKILYDYELLLF